VLLLICAANFIAASILVVKNAPADGCLRLLGYESHDRMMGPVAAVPNGAATEGISFSDCSSGAGWGRCND
jgi:hypothetical protein